MTTDRPEESESTPGHRSQASAPIDRNVRLIDDLERGYRLRRTATEHLIDRFGIWAGHPAFPLMHAAWFGTWIAYNVWAPHPFDPFPFTFLTLMVSLEAILLTSFVLAAQNRMTQEADRRGKLDLQVDMLAEQELTAILRGVCALTDRAGIDLAAEVPQLHALRLDTPIERLAKAVETGRPSDADK